MRRLAFVRILALLVPGALCAQAPPPAASSPPRVKRSAQQADLRVKRLETLADLWGQLFLFHPNVAVGGQDWERVLVEAIPRVEAARSTDEFVAALNAHLFMRLGDPLAFAQRATTPGAPIPSAPTRFRAAGGTRRVAHSVMYWDASDVDAYGTTFLRRAAADLRDLGPGDTLIVDLRWRAQDIPYHYIGLGALGLFVRTRLRAGYHVAREHEGWAEASALSCGVSADCELYRQFWQIEPAFHIEPLRSGDLRLATDTAGAATDSFRPIAVPTVLLVNTPSALQQDLALDALQSQEDVAVVWEKTGRFFREGTLRYADGVEARLGTWTLVSQSGRLGFRPDVERAEIVSDTEFAAVAREALRAKRERRDDPRPRFANQMRVSPARTVSSAPLSREERLLGLFKIWTVVRYLDPHLELASVDWARMLPAWIPRVEAASDLSAYVWELRDIAATLNDSHAGVSHPSAGALGAAKPPVRLQRVEGRVIVAEVRSGPADTVPLSPGEEVLAIDGRSVAAVEAQWRPFVSSSSPQGFSKRMWEGASGALQGRPDSSVELTVRGDAGVRRVRLRRSLRGDWIPRDTTYFRELPGNLGYVNTLLLPNAASLDSALTALRHTDGLVLDLRGYPRTDLFRLVQRLTDRPLAYPPIEIPVAMLKPGAESPPCCGRLRVAVDSLDPLDGPRYLKPVVVLINGIPQSHPEAVALFIRERPRVRFVGTPTTGAEGTVSPVVIPSGARFRFSGDVWFNPDGTRLQNVGVQPDVRVEPTIRGIREGRDEILEGGIKVLKEMLAGQQAR